MTDNSEKKQSVKKTAPKDKAKEAPAPFVDAPNWAEVEVNIKKAFDGVDWSAEKHKANSRFTASVVIKHTMPEVIKLLTK